MWTFILCVGVAFVFFGLGLWLGPKITRVEENLRRQIADLEAQIASGFRRK